MRVGVFSLIALASVSGEQVKTAVPPYIWEVVSNATNLKSAPRSFARNALSAKAQSLRTKENCKFPLEVVIVQDVTDSFSDNIASMTNTQIDLIYSGITGAHPDSKFAVVSHKDKPITPLGNRDDYCTQYDAPLTADLALIKGAYSKLVSYGGADAPENQFGTLVNVLSANKISWSTDDLAVKLVVLSTDAGMHFAGDSSSSLLPPFNPNAINDDDMSVCLASYYPSPDYVKRVIANSGAYVASLVYDGDWANGWPSKSWITFNDFIGQKPDFVASQAPDSSDFWANLAKIITIIEEEQCEDVTSTTPAPTTTLSPTTTPAPVTTAGTTQATTTTPAPATTTTKGECVCPCDECDCCPEVVIKLQHRPNKLVLNLENATA